MTTEAWLEDIPTDACWEYLRGDLVGRIGLVEGDWPFIVPVNYRVVEGGELPWIALRTRPGGPIDRIEAPVAFEVDGIDRAHHRGWSVLVRGILHRVDETLPGVRERLDPAPWLMTERDAWFVIEPRSVTGRQLHAATLEWPFLAHGYL